MSLYTKRGVSAQKEEVHAATKNLDKGLFPRAFCKINEDLLGGDSDWVNVMHADGAGTKSILAYLYWKETGDLSVWKGIAQDAIVMNLDDLLCIGIYKNLLYSSSIDRNKSRIPGEVLKALIEGTQEFLDQMSSHGVSIAFLGGETADVGDVVRTVAVNGTMASRWRKKDLVTNEAIAPGNVIVGLASYGKAVYETGYNSGIGSNGLTSARHDVLSKAYASYTESYDETLEDDVVYIGHHSLTDSITIGEEQIQVGKLLLSPTRTFAPLMKEILEEHFTGIHGLIHSSGGGQTKCLKYMPDGVRIVKDNLFKAPEIFSIIQGSSGSDDKEMYQVFNMGCRMEIYTDEAAANAIIQLGQSFEIEAQVIGRVEAGVGKSLVIRKEGAEIVY
ncbi:MAG: phosphoribosylformylglycinamidine cyclo-ligase [Flaviaesturariibacter sp.]|nr:phosphoribosylformylglycinamidine cyclo-ligase [Flaviaesturariibacter sp.]